MKSSFETGWNDTVGEKLLFQAEDALGKAVREANKAIEPCLDKIEHTPGSSVDGRAIDDFFNKINNALNELEATLDRV